LNNMVLKIWNEYQKGIAYNTAHSLYDTVKRNENFYLGKQWEGLNAPDLEKPVLNFLKRCVDYEVSVLISNDIGLDIRSFYNENDEYDEKLTRETERVFERCSIRNLSRDVLRNAAIDGDSALFFRFDTEADNGFGGGEIAAELVDNTNIIFGNPCSVVVQEQPYIIIVRRRSLESVREYAAKRGMENAESIMPDNEKLYFNEENELNSELCTVLLRLWKDKESGHIMFCESTKDAMIVPPTDTGYELYPICYVNWEKVKNSYHGQALINQGAVQNQIYVNTLWALFMIHQKKLAFPKTFYDATKIDRWTNKVGAAIGVIGNPNEAIAASFRAPDFSAQAMELVEKTIAYTKEFLGATDAALGNVEPDNASAIIALQQATAAPLEIQRRSYYQFMEDAVRIILDIIRCEYGLRTVLVKGEDGKRRRETMDFNAIDYDALDVHVEIGASSYWSELMQVQTADNLFQKGIISDAISYLESIPDKHLMNKNKLIADLKAKKEDEKAALGQADAGQAQNLLGSLMKM